jgi:hypothetical protein
VTSAGVDPDLIALARQVGASGHSALAPSAASRWLRCPGSVVATMRRHTDTAGYDAAWGTVAHRQTECILRDNAPAYAHGQVVVENGFEVVIDDEMDLAVARAVEWVQSLGSGWVLFEQRVLFDHLTPIPDQGGTADVIHLSPDGDVLTIQDHKFGTGVRVFATENDQLRIYAIGAMRLLGVRPKRIVLRVCQPRLDHFDEWSCDVEHLDRFAEEVRAAAHAAFAPNPPRNATPSGCRFCPVKADCAEIASAVERMADVVFADEPAEIDPGIAIERVGDILRWRGTIDAWFKALEQRLLEALEGGARVPGWKIAEGRVNRKWADPDQAAAMLQIMGLPEERVFDRVLITPAEAERRLAKFRMWSRKSALDGLTVKPQPPRTVARDIDPRSALAASASVFEPVSDDDL